MLVGVHKKCKRIFYLKRKSLKEFLSLLSKLRNLLMCKSVCDPNQEWIHLSTNGRPNSTWIFFSHKFCGILQILWKFHKFSMISVENWIPQTFRVNSSTVTWKNVIYGKQVSCGIWYSSTLFKRSNFCVKNSILTKNVFTSFSFKYIYIFFLTIFFVKSKLSTA